MSGEEGAGNKVSVSFYKALVKHRRSCNHSDHLAPLEEHAHLTGQASGGC